MDSVQNQARSMKQRLGAHDRDKLEQYFTAVRVTEQRLAKAEAWESKPRPQVAVPVPQDINNVADVVGRARLMFDMIHLALQTDSTRLITLFNPGVNAVPPIAAYSGLPQSFAPRAGSFPTG